MNILEALWAAIKEITGLGDGDNFYGACALCSALFPLSKPFIKTLPPPNGFDPLWAAIATCAVCLVLKRILHALRDEVEIPTETAAIQVVALPLLLAAHFLFTYAYSGTVVGLRRAFINWGVYTWIFVACTLLFTGRQLRLYNFGELVSFILQLKKDNIVGGSLMFFVIIFLLY